MLLFKLPSAVLKAPRKRLEGGPGLGRRGRCETPPQTILHSGAKSLLPKKTAFQRRAAPGPPCLCPSTLPPDRSPRSGGCAPSRRRPCRGAGPKLRAPEAPTGDGPSRDPDRCCKLRKLRSQGAGAGKREGGQRGLTFHTVSRGMDLLVSLTSVTESASRIG